MQKSDTLTSAKPTLTDTSKVRTLSYRQVRATPSVTLFASKPKLYTPIRTSSTLLARTIITSLYVML